ncbi:MAG: 3-dehydroquinate synthase II [Thermoplasmata archaeon]|nr:3-dehydroquinate synthase II [Thermoplasmata archaeon]
MSRDRIAIRPRSATPAGRRAIRERARIRGFHVFVLPSTDPPQRRPGETVIRQTGRTLRGAGAGAPSVHLRRIGSEAELTRVLTSVPTGGVLAIEWVADRVIPLENAVAARGHRFSLWALARTHQEVPGALGALEHGADLVIVDVDSSSDVDALEAILEGPLPMRLDWAYLPLTSVGPVGVGDRVIVDTTSLLLPEEGLLVGSAAAFLFHVASEAVGSRFSRPRAFRVNAGAAHSYVLLADGTTRYLSELAPGDPVLIATPEAGVRSVRVGRVKVERRPLVLMVADDRGTARTLFAQEAESVRVSTRSGPVSTTHLRAGMEVRGIRLPAARHLGRAIEETIEER